MKSNQKTQASKRFLAKQPDGPSWNEELLPRPPEGSRRWMSLGVLALAVGGLFSILLVLARTPVIQKNIPFKDFFHTALVVHVDLTVLAWFLAMLCLLWQITAGPGFAQARRWAAGCFLAFILCLAAAPFVSAEPLPLMNNYIPVLQHPLFFVGLGFLAAAMTIQASCGLLAWRHRAPVTAWAMGGASVIVLASMLVTVFSLQRLPLTGLDAESFYEALFWAGGHMLQFAHTHALVLVWLFLASAIGVALPMPRIGWQLLLGGGMLAALAGLAPPFIWPVLSYEYNRFYTLQMAIANGGYVVPVALWLLVNAWRQRNSLMAPVLKSSLGMSLLLFFAGGGIALLIREVDVTIPAHYHGSIVGISLAYMGMAYAMLPHLGGREVTGRAAFWQPVVYGAGQLLHITGLLISGGYDVARKTTESYDGVTGAQVGMGLMGLGGLIAIIGGLMFVIIIWRHRRPAQG